MKWQCNQTNLVFACVQDFVFALIEHDELDSHHPAATGDLSPLVWRPLWLLEPAEGQK